MTFSYPKLYLLVIAVTVPSLVGWAIGNHYGWDFFNFLLSLELTFGAWWAGLSFLSHWQNEFLYYRNMDTKPAPAYVPQTRNIPNLSEGTGYGLVTSRVQVNVEMLFAQAVMQMWRGGDKVDLTEGYWIKGGHWQAIGGAGRDSLVDLLTRWEAAGAIRRKNPAAKNSPYVIANRGRVAQAAGRRQL